MKRGILSVLLAGTVVGPWAGLQAQGPGSDMPDGDGKAPTLRMCGTNCHDIGTVIEQRKTEAEWAQTVSDMVAMGGEGTGDEQKIVAAYLGKYFGRVQTPPAAPAPSSTP